MKNTGLITIMIFLLVAMSGFGCGEREPEDRDGQVNEVDGDGDSGEGDGEGEGDGDGDEGDLVGNSLSISPLELNFLLQGASESEEKVITFTNRGDETLRVWDFTLEDGNGRFSAGQNFPSGEILLASGQNYQLGIRYVGQNQEDQDQSGSLVFTSNDPGLLEGSIPLNVLALPVPVLSYFPGELLFPRTLPGDESTRTLVIENTGLEDLIIDFFSIDPLSPFSITSNTALPHRITPGGTPLEVEVTFAAPSLNAIFDELVIESNDPRSEQTIVTLGGNVSGAACMNLSTGALSFGNSAVDEVTYRVVHIENCSDQRDLGLSAIEIEDDSENVFSITTASLPSGLPGGSASIPPQESRTLVIGFEPTEVGTFEGALRIESNSFVDPVRTVTLSGTGFGSGGCPVAVAEGRVGGGTYTGGILVAQVLDEVELRGTSSSDPDGEPLVYEWSLISAPGSSQSSILPDNASPTGTLFLDTSGVYKVELNVYTLAGVGACETSIFEIQALTGSDILVELTWSPEGIATPVVGSGSDLDLHYHHSNGSWGDQSWSVFWMHRAQAWDGSEARLDIDSMFGELPEIISHSNPANGTYTVGVHYYSAGTSEGYTDATVRIFLNGALGFEKTKRIFSPNDLWEVGAIEWSSSPTVVEIDEIVTDHGITFSP